MTTMRALAALLLLACPALAQTPNFTGTAFVATPSPLSAADLNAGIAYAIRQGSVAAAGLPSLRSTATAPQSIPGAQPGDNMALPSILCTPVGQNVAASIVCLNMTSPASVPASLPQGNNYRSSPNPNATTVNIGLENYGGSTTTGVGLYVGAEAQAGAGTTWALNTVTNILAGATSGGAGAEIDVNNVDCDPGLGGVPNCGPVYGAWITGLTGFTNSVGLLITKGGGPGTNPLWHLGVDVTSADLAAYQDTSGAEASFASQGTHAVGLNFAAGNYTTGAAQLNGSLGGNNPQMVWLNVPQSTSVPGSIRTNGNFALTPSTTTSGGVPAAQMAFTQPDGTGPHFQGVFFFSQAGVIGASGGYTGGNDTAAALFPNGLALAGGSASPFLTGNNGDLVITPSSGGGGYQLAPQLSGTLPVSCTPGTVRYASDARNPGEAVGNGTGALAVCNKNHAWLANGVLIN